MSEDKTIAQGIIEEMVRPGVHPVEETNRMLFACVIALARACDLLEASAYKPMIGVDQVVLHATGR